MSPPNTLLHKCTAAHKLVFSLQEIIAASRAERTYPKWSDDFLTFCEQTAVRTLARLDEWLKDYAQGALPIGILSERLSSIIHAWELLHSFIKPVLDADNLRVPYPLVHFLSEHIGKLPVVQGAKFATEISPELNYFQHPHTDLRNALIFLQALVRGPAIRARLGFLALPCSQSRSLFMNCLLYHEVGHFIAEEHPCLPPISELGNELKLQFKQYSNWAASRIRMLMEELFADLVAVRLIGLAYTLSYMELIRLVTQDLPRHAKRFFVDHPADALRLREQLKILKDDKWDEYGKKLPQWQELTKIAKLTEAEYLVPKEYENDPEMALIWKMLIQSLCDKKRLRKLHNLVNTVLNDRENPHERFLESAKVIEECLAHAIVPSVRISGGMPHPLGIMNVAVAFWLSGMGNLWDTVGSKSRKRVADRAFLENRVEMWCLKGIEDWLLTKTQN